jgi:hypothetical protein
VADRLNPDCLYSLVRIGDMEYACSDFDHYARALGQSWDAGFVPESRPSALGAELPGAAPRLQGVDVDLAGPIPPAVRLRPRRKLRR